MKFVRDQYSNARFKRIYNARTDGWKASDFHRCCDQKERTLSIVKTTDNYIFGGFTTAEWTAPGIAGDILPKVGLTVLAAFLFHPLAISHADNYTSNESKISSESFLFSVNEGNKYPISWADKTAIVCDRT